MANHLYSAGIEGFASGQIVWGGPSVIKVALLSNYLFNTAHRFMSDVIAAGAVIAAASPGLSAMSYTAGVLDATDVTFPAVPAGPPITSYVVYQASAVTGGADVPQNAQRVIAYFDSVNSGLPLTPDGSNVTLQFDDGAYRILAL